jgi:uncharacterized membrane protein YkoI
MNGLGRVAIVLTVLVLVPARAEQAARPKHSGAAPPACLDQSERWAAEKTGRVINLASAMRAAKKRMPGTVVRARLCHGKNGLVYLLTVLARDGKVARLTVDAAKGTVVGQR